ncbi:235_t:CDS:2, partial [Scutellospora calospora]
MQELPIEEQKFAKEIQKYRNTIIYEIDGIKNLFHKTINEKLHDIKTTEKDKFVKSLKEIINKDVNNSKKIDMEHIIFIIFAIFDSESLVFLNNIAGDYTKKVKNYYKSDLEKNIKYDHEYIDQEKSDLENDDKKIDRYIERFIIIRVLVEIFLKNIPLIIIM